MTSQYETSLRYFFLWDGVLIFSFWFPVFRAIREQGNRRGAKRLFVARAQRVALIRLPASKFEGMMQALIPIIEKYLEDFLADS